VYKKHFRVNHDNNEFVNVGLHINGIEGFWGYAKTRLSKFRGFDKNKFYLHLKECEFRYNHCSFQLLSYKLNHLQNSCARNLSL